MRFVSKGNPMTPKYLGISAFAKHVGLTDSTIQGYFLKGMLPAPEIYYLTGKGERPGRGRTYASMNDITISATTSAS